MKIKVLIVEDEALIAEEISECLTENDFEVTEIVATSHGALKSIKENRPDVILMDISIKGEENGIGLSKRILQTDNYPIVFLTSNTQTGIVKEASELKPSAFLLKPFNEKELPIAIELAFSNHNKDIITSKKPLLKDSIFVKNGKMFERIKLTDILYIQADGSYSSIKTTSGNYTLALNLSHFNEEINNGLFIRVHRSYVINLHNITSFDANSILIGDITVPISKQFQETFLEGIKKI